MEEETSMVGSGAIRMLAISRDVGKPQVAHPVKSEDAGPSEAVTQKTPRAKAASGPRAGKKVSQDTITASALWLMHWGFFSLV